MLKTTRELLHYSMKRVRDYDTPAYFPGKYLVRDQAKYFALRAFYIETSRPRTTEQVEWWRNGIHSVVFDDDQPEGRINDFNDPILLLLRHVRDHETWQGKLFDNIIDARLRDLQVKQYETIEDLMEQSKLSCGSLLRLLLPSTPTIATTTHDAIIHHVGIGHGLTQQLRNSIPLLSTARRLVIPTELTTRYNVRSPRFLLSALAQGDTTCQTALQNAVRDVADLALNEFEQARSYQQDVPPVVATELAALTVPSQVWLERLANHDYQLTNPDLRTVGLWERGKCAAKSVDAYLRAVY